MPAAPSDLVINNTKGNESITVTVHLVTGSRDSAKVEITYTFLGQFSSSCTDYVCVCACVYIYIQCAYQQTLVSKMWCYT